MGFSSGTRNQNIHMMVDTFSWLSAWLASAFSATENFESQSLLYLIRSKRNYQMRSCGLPNSSSVLKAEKCSFRTSTTAMFTTERLSLRAYQDSDKPAVNEFLNTPEVYSTLNGEKYSPRPRSSVDEFISAMEKTTFFAIITTRSTTTRTAEFVGYVNVNLRNARNRGGILAVGIIPRQWEKDTPVKP